MHKWETFWHLAFILSALPVTTGAHQILIILSEHSTCAAKHSIQQFLLVFSSIKVCALYRNMPTHAKLSSYDEPNPANNKIETLKLQTKTVIFVQSGQERYKEATLVCLVSHVCKPKLSFRLVVPDLINHSGTFKTSKAIQQQAHNHLK